MMIALAFFFEKKKKKNVWVRLLLSAQVRALKRAREGSNG